MHRDSHRGFGGWLAGRLEAIARWLRTRSRRNSYNRFEVHIDDADHHAVMCDASSLPEQPRRRFLSALPGVRTSSASVTHVIRQSGPTITLDGDDLDHVPADIRKHIDDAIRDFQANAAAGSRAAKQEFRYTGPDGVEHVYDRLDDMPDHVRRFFDSMRHLADSNHP